MADSTAKPSQSPARSTARRGSNGKIDHSQIERYIQLFNELNLAELSIKGEAFRLELSRYPKNAAPATVQPQVLAPVQVPAAPLQDPSGPAPSSPPAETPPPKPENVIEITSPIVGTFYEAPSPDSPPFVKVGDKVSPDDTVCIVEAMKMMNEIKAEVSGKIVAIKVKNADSVQQGAVLFEVEA